MRLAPLLLFFLVIPVSADERILSFHADILVRQDGWIEVTETTVVRAEGRVIRRGTVREYPTEYRDGLGNRVEVEYQPRSLLRNGRPEDFHTERYANGVRTYFGSADRFLEHGEHTYEYRYDAGRMLGFFEEHDELYWNVTGVDSAFPIDRASATVRFEFEPPEESIQARSFTGPFGSTDTHARTDRSKQGVVGFTSSKVLPPGEGLTIVVGWPKGFVQQPTMSARTVWLLKDNINLLVAVSGLITMLAYYILTWRRFGRDPEPGVVFTRYEPPEKFSPASLRYIDNMAYDNKAFSAAIVNLAVKGYLKIEDHGDTHVLIRQPLKSAKAELAAGEMALLQALFANGGEVELVNKNHRRLSNAKSAHSQSLEKDFAGRYFRSNGLMNLPGIAIAVVSLLIALAAGDGPTPLVVVCGLLMLVLIIAFITLLKQPTIAGRKLLDQLDGFREYLDIAEKDEMNLRNPPEKTPELFEKYLPFALAIGVEQAWAEKFATVFSRLAEKGTSWSPSWHSGNFNSARPLNSMVSLTDSLSSSISSASTPPGSSSGGSGGFSGGGGGGGGTGGW